MARLVEELFHQTDLLAPVEQASLLNTQPDSMMLIIGWHVLSIGKYLVCCRDLDMLQDRRTEELNRPFTQPAKTWRAREVTLKPMPAADIGSMMCRIYVSRIAYRCIGSQNGGKKH